MPAVRSGLNKSRFVSICVELGREGRPEAAWAAARTHRIRPWGPSGAPRELPQWGGSVLWPLDPGPQHAASLGRLGEPNGSCPDWPVGPPAHLTRASGLPRAGSQSQVTSKVLPQHLAGGGCTGLSCPTPPPQPSPSPPTPPQTPTLPQPPLTWLLSDSPAQDFCTCCVLCLAPAPWTPFLGRGTPAQLPR